MVTVLLTLCLILLVLGTPIFIVLSMPALLVILFMTDLPPTVIIQQLWGGMDKFALMPMPFFVYAANLMSAGGLSRRMISWAVAVMGRFKGGLGLATQISCMFFGTVSGSSAATVAGIGKIAYPALIENNYPRGFSSGLITSGATVAVLIPPSIAMVVYGSITGASVGAMFIAGISAGLVYGGITLLYCIYRARRDNMKPLPPAPLKVVLRESRNAAWAIGVAVIILGGIYFGVFTPTEASAVAVIYSIAVSVLVYREMGWKKFMEVSIESAVLSAELMLLTGAAGVLGWVSTIGQLPQMIADNLMAVTTDPMVFLMLMNVFLLVLGMFIDGVPAIVLVTPLLFPLAMQLGVNPVHLGIVITINMAIGMLTPPFGLNIFVAADITREPFLEVARNCLPFVLVCIIALAILTYIPEISLWLPRLLYGNV